MEALLFALLDEFVSSASEFAAKLAAVRGSDEVELEDVKYYVEKVLGLHVPGFYQAGSGGGSDNAGPPLARLQGGGGSRARLIAQMKRKAHVLQPEPSDQ